MITIKQNRRAMGLVATIALVAIGAIVIFLQLTDDAKAGIGYWPPLTMVYEVKERESNGVQLAEVHRLEYRSTSDWTDTVIESDPIETLADGIVNTIGSYVKLYGSSVEDYDSVTDDITVTDSEGIFVPNAFLVPMHISEIAKAYNLTQASTGATVCHQADCEQNAGGLAVELGNGVEWVFANESRWGIPLKVGDKFLVRELTIDAAKR